jgi:hypothetical protein
MQRYLRTCFLTTALLACVPAHANESSKAMAEFRARQSKLAALGDGGMHGKSLAEIIFVSDFEGDDIDPSCSVDSDADGLPDCAETGTGVYVDSTDTGTDAQRADTDSDGLSDGEEVLGALNGLDLPSLGVNPLRRDLLVEYDWFVHESSCGTNSYRPAAEVMERVAAIYAQADVLNPDGSRGIHVVQDAGQGSALAGGNQIQGYSAVLPGSFDETYYAIRNANLDPRRVGYFHYVMLAHQYNGGSTSSGYAEVVGDDVIISLGCFLGADYVTRTIVHELGHNMGLLHGGFEACNGKPNYNSLMNYRYQFAGIDASCDASGDPSHDDYSSGTRATIDESAIDEARGVCGDPAIDWNSNGSVETGIALDLNPNFAGVCGAGLSEIEDFNDWANITLLGIRDVSGQLKSIQQEVGCAGAPAP